MSDTPVAYEIDFVLMRVSIIRPQHVTCHSLLIPSTKREFLYAAQLLTYAELGYHLVPRVIASVASHIQRDMFAKKRFRYEADQFRDLLETVRVATGFSDLRFAEKRGGPHEDSD